MLLKPELYEPDFENTISCPQLAGFNLLCFEIMGDHAVALSIINPITSGGGRLHHSPFISCIFETIQAQYVLVE
jgi:hypothetical protein